MTCPSKRCGGYSDNQDENPLTLIVALQRRLCCDGSAAAVTESKESSAAKIRGSAEVPDRANASRDSSAVPPAVSSNGLTDVIPAVTPVNSHNAAMTDLVDDPSRGAFAIPPATSADNATTGSTVASQVSTRTDSAHNPSRDAFEIPPASAPRATVGRSRPSRNLSRKHSLVLCALRVNPG